MLQAMPWSATRRWNCSLAHWPPLPHPPWWTIGRASTSRRASQRRTPPSRVSMAGCGRIAERDTVHLAPPGPGRTRTLAVRLQRCATSLAPRMEDTIRARVHQQPATGSSAALCRWLRTSSRRYLPIEQIHQPERMQGDKGKGATEHGDQTKPALSGAKICSHAL